MRKDNKEMPGIISTEQELEEILSRPYPGTVDTCRTLNGDIMILGVAGKMGPSLAVQIKRGCRMANKNNKIIGVARFSDLRIKEYLEKSGIETICCDLLDRDAVDKLPEVENVIFMAGMKFGTHSKPSLTWAMNSYVPALVATKYKNSRIVVLSTGNVYSLVPVNSKGSKETDIPCPIGEYAQSCLGRERVFEYFSETYRIPSCIIRLNYAVELRYGVIYDIGTKVFRNEPVNIENGYVNVIWQGWANSIIFQCLNICSAPPEILNLTGPEILSVRRIAEEFGSIFGKKVIFEGNESETAYLSDASECFRLFGKPDVDAMTIVRWVAHWIKIGGRALNKPTHFEERKGRY